MGTIQPARFLSHTGQILPGVRKVVTVPNPAAAADWNVSVPAGNMWYVVSGFATLTASAAVAGRVPSLRVTVNGVLVWSVFSAAAITAGQIAQLTFAPNVAINAGNGGQEFVEIPYPDTYLPQGSVISTLTGSIQAGDQWSTIALLVEEIWMTDTQLSEREREKEAIERQIIRDELQQAHAGGGY